MKLLLTEGHEVKATPALIHFGFPCDVIKLRVTVPIGETFQFYVVGVPNEVNMNRYTAALPLASYQTLDNSTGTSVLMWEQTFSALHSIKYESTVSGLFHTFLFIEYYKL
jgi:hypothetical protein